MPLLMKRWRYYIYDSTPTHHPAGCRNQDASSFTSPQRPVHVASCIYHSPILTPATPTTPTIRHSQRQAPFNDPVPLRVKARPASAPSCTKPEHVSPDTQQGRHSAAMLTAPSPPRGLKRVRSRSPLQNAELHPQQHHHQHHQHKHQHNKHSQHSHHNQHSHHSPHHVSQHNHNHRRPPVPRRPPRAPHPRHRPPRPRHSNQPVLRPSPPSTR
ncbi:hypothetical protein EDC01DRAFT_677415 [Geopyxis carbonaria]|nr:hypothetical protein EDC01DRAFT_677415 [Geopyxis carbonaria]